MTTLTSRELELVALGAAMGSNCAPCIDYHIREAKKTGLGEQEIMEAIQFADKVRQVPANKVLQTALRLLPSATDGFQRSPAAENCGCASDAGAARPESKEAGRSHDMIGMMANMMEWCGCQPGAAMDGSASTQPAGKGCGCG